MTKDPDWIEVYKDDRGHWRWRIQSPNGRILGDSAEGYVQKRQAVTMANRIAKGGMDVRT